MHRDPDVYSRPHDFVPERWLEGTPEHAADNYRCASQPRPFTVSFFLQYLCMLLFPSMLCEGVLAFFCMAIWQ